MESLKVKSNFHHMNRFIGDTVEYRKLNSFILRSDTRWHNATS